MENILTRQEIIDRLKQMSNQSKNWKPIKYFGFIVVNNEYNPSEFSQEIEDSEQEIDTWKLVMEEIKRPGFDWITNNNISKLPKNSDKWLNNHLKICKVKFLPNEMLLSAITHGDGTRDYYSEEYVDKIMSVGNVVSFC